MVPDLQIIRNVVARYKGAESMGDPKELVREFEAAIRGLILPADKIAWAKGVIQREMAIVPPRSIRDWKDEYSEVSDLAYKALFSVKHGQRKVAEPGHKLFLALLQTYALPPALRKKIEIASRFYLKDYKPRTKQRGVAGTLEYFTIYETFMVTLETHLAIAKEAIAKGKEHSEEGGGATKIKVGPFTLVNTGGFSEKQMNEVADVMQKVTAFAQTSGLGAVCYGEVQVTNTISKGSVLAFYLIAKDELFVRANVKASTDTVRTVLHELGHRYEHKFMAGSKREVERLYHLLAGQEVKRKYDTKAKQKKPEPGETMVAKGKTYVVTQTLPDRNGYKVLLEQKGDPKAKASITLDGWLAAKGETARDLDTDPNYIGYVSDYAKKGGPGENFAEMFSFYCTGRLPVLQSAPFESLVFGTEKTASERVSHRVASRFVGGT